jgi:two-component system, response regulator PdtaR
MPKVLIAEDSVMLADMLEDFLISEGYDVCGVAHTVQEAVTLANLHKPELAVLDFRLADGEYGSQIRQLLKDKDSMGILYVSGDPLTNKLTKADGDAYIQKPYGMFDLVKALCIVQEVKTHGYISASIFPKGFHLLGYPDSNNRIAA